MQHKTIFRRSFKHSLEFEWFEFWFVEPHLQIYCVIPFLSVVAELAISGMQMLKARVAFLVSTPWITIAVFSGILQSFPVLGPWPTSLENVAGCCYTAGPTRAVWTGMVPHLCCWRLKLVIGKWYQPCCKASRAEELWHLEGILWAPMDGVHGERQEYQSNLLEKRYPMSIQSANPAFYHLPSLIGDVSIVAARNLKMATALHLAAEGGLEV